MNHTSQLSTLKHAKTDRRHWVGKARKSFKFYRNRLNRAIRRSTPQLIAAECCA